MNQIGRAIARSLRLNEDLVEAMALGHDIGHTPFGHIGEELLARFLPEGFRHNQQSVRIAEKLENNGAGLRLTMQTLDGMLKHSSPTEGGLETASIMGDEIANARRNIPRAVILAGALIKDHELVSRLVHSHGDYGEALGVFLLALRRHAVVVFLCSLRMQFGPARDALRHYLISRYDILV